MKKTLVYACDKNYFDFTKASFATFCEHHKIPDWERVFVDVGLEPAQKAELSRFGEVRSYPSGSNPRLGIHWPSSRARLAILHDLVGENNTLVYVDSDTLFFDNIDGLVAEFADVGTPLGMLLENLNEFGRAPTSWGWRDGLIPAEFVNQNKWRNRPMINAGVLLARGPEARKIGQLGLMLFEKHFDRLWLAEQTVINTLVYEYDIPFAMLNPIYNCIVWEKHIRHVGSGKKYIDTQPFFGDEAVAIRHFAGSQSGLPSKSILEQVLPDLQFDHKLSIHFP